MENEKNELTLFSGVKNNMYCSIVADSEDATNVYLSARNIAGATVMSASAINTYDLVNANKVVMTSAAVKQVEEALA